MAPKSNKITAMKSASSSIAKAKSNSISNMKTSSSMKTVMKSSTMKSVPAAKRQSTGSNGSNPGNKKRSTAKASGKATSVIQKSSGGGARSSSNAIGKQVENKWPPLVYDPNLRIEDLTPQQLVKLSERIRMYHTVIEMNEKRTLDVSNEPEDKRKKRRYPVPIPPRQKIPGDWDDVKVNKLIDDNSFLNDLSIETSTESIAQRDQMTEEYRQKQCQDSEDNMNLTAVVSDSEDENLHHDPETNPDIVLLNNNNSMGIPDMNTFINRSKNQSQNLTSLGGSSSMKLQPSDVPGLESATKSTTVTATKGNIGTVNNQSKTAIGKSTKTNTTNDMTSKNSVSKTNKKTGNVRPSQRNKAAIVPQNPPSQRKETNDNNRFFINDPKVITTDKLLQNNLKSQVKFNDPPNGTIDPSRIKNKSQIIAGTKRTIKTDLGVQREKALTRQIAKYQSADCSNLIAKSHFRCLIKDILDSMGFSNSSRSIIHQPITKWSSNAITILQRIMEDTTVTRLATAMMLAAHAKRVTLQPRDVILVRKLKQSLRTDIKLMGEM